MRPIESYIVAQILPVVSGVTVRIKKRTEKNARDKCFFNIFLNPMVVSKWLSFSMLFYDKSCWFTGPVVTVAVVVACIPASSKLWESNASLSVNYHTWKTSRSEEETSAWNLWSLALYPLGSMKSLSFWWKCFLTGVMTSHNLRVMRMLLVAALSFLILIINSAWMAKGNCTPLCSAGKSQPPTEKKRCITSVSDYKQWEAFIPPMSCVCPSVWSSD